MRYGLFSAVLFAISLLSLNAFAQTSKCDALSAEAKGVAEAVMGSAYLYDCCDNTISACLKAEQPCALATRLADEVCRLAGAGKPAEDIKRTLEQRAMTMGGLTPPSKIEVLPEHVWGNPESKVILSVYLCGRCPYCSRHVPKLIHALEKSPLKDKVAVNLRLFPIKTHDYSTPAALAVEAAAAMGNAWPYLIKSYENFDSFTTSKTVEWATEVGLDGEKFKALMQEAQIRNKVVESKKEGLVNSVDSTPTFFLNGHRIQGTFDVDSIISMLEEAVEK